MKKFLVTYQKQRFLTYKIEAESASEAEEIANDEDEKFGIICETPYFVASVLEDKD